MSYNPPAHGEANWDGKLNPSLQYLKDTAEAAETPTGATDKANAAYLAAAAHADAGDTAVTASLSAHTGNTSNPHAVTKAQVGLGNVDNTSDLAKPVSTATTAAINAAAATTDTFIAGKVNDNASATRAALTATIAAREKAPKLYHLNTYDNFLPDPTWVFKLAQGNTATTATAGASAGDLTITLTDVTGLSTDVVLIMGAGTTQQQIKRILSIAGSVVTLTTALDFPVANGDAVTPLWKDDRHLTHAGFLAFGYFIANAKDAAGNYIITGTAPKVTYLCNSWVDQDGPAYSVPLLARIPGATFVDAGVSGNTSTQLLARFDTDVPADTNYLVINEPGVNDTANGFTASLSASNLEALWRKARAIGATVIYTGFVPIQPFPAVAAARSTQFKALLGDGSSFPGVTPTGIDGLYQSIGMTKVNVNSLGVGDGALASVTTGTNLTALGYNAGTALTSATTSVAIGYASLAAASTATGNTAVGSLALRNATSNNNTGIGTNALTAVTSGANNSGSGFNAGAKINTGQGNAAYGYAALGEVTTTSFNTAVGGLALRNATGASLTAVGYNALTALTSGIASTAVGYNAGAALTTGGSSTVVGYAALATASTANSNTVVGTLALTLATGSFNTAIGHNAATGQTTGAGNVHIGYEAAHLVAGAANTDQTTTASNQVVVGRQAGGNADNITAVGYFSKATGTGSFVFGAGTSATASGSGAIGRDSAGTGASTTTQDEIALGTSLHQIKVSNNTTGPGSAALGANSPATTNTAPYTWFKMKSGDGSTVYVPAWK